MKFLSPHIALFTLAVAALAATAAYGGEFVIAARGKAADCAIVVSSDAGLMENRAAKELRTYTKKMTGVELAITNNAVEGKAIVIDLRKTISPRDADAFGIKVEGNRLCISGGRRGVLYGVYELLERFGGCDWYAPGCEEVPSRKTFAVPDDLAIEERPAFIYRSLAWGHTVKGKDGGAFAAKMRLNGRNRAKQPLCGGSSVCFPKGLFADHAFNSLVPAKEHFAAHPDWFSEVGGVRVGDQTQLCWSNGEMRKFLVERLKERLREVKREPDQLLVASIGQNDCGNYCRCAKCAEATKEEESPAGPNLRFANAVAEEIEKEFPDVIIATHAYQWSQRPPKITKARHNVMVQLCAFTCGYSVPFEKSDNPGTKAFVEDLKGWSKVCDKLSIRQYGTCFNYFLYPFPDLFSFGPNVRLYRDCGAWLLSTQVCGNYHADLAELKCYVQSKLMWNPDRPIEPLIDKFLKGFYGAAAPHVRKYIDDLYAAMGVPMDPDAMPELDHVHGGIYTQVIPQLTDEILDGLYATLREGEKAVAKDKKRLFNVRMAEFAPIMVRLARLYGDNFRRVWAAEDIAPHVAGMEKLRPVAVDFLAHFDEARKRKHPIQLAENWRGRHLRLMADFQSMANWTPPQLGCDAAVASTNDAVKRIPWERAWHLPIREIACDEGVKYRVRAHLRPSPNPLPPLPGISTNGFGYGIRVEWRKKQPRGSVRKRVPAEDVKPDWEWYDLGEYDFSALQKYPRPTLDWLCLFVQGDVELDKFEISRERK